MSHVTPTYEGAAFFYEILFGFFRSKGYAERLVAPGELHATETVSVASRLRLMEKNPFGLETEPNQAVVEAQERFGPDLDDVRCTYEKVCELMLFCKPT